jgi:acetyl/propionyl-CoA carboxylase alpha subunit/acetyl-CoA carboxylase carboxyltransferase component
MKIHNILIANRGLSAIKFISSIKEWILIENRNIELIGISTDEDMKSNYKYLDYLDRIIYSSDNNIYKSIDEIIQICIENNIQAVWPGWGYLSEEPEFSRELEKNGIIFIGPSDKSLNFLGDKIECMKQADIINIPQLPWSRECCDSVDQLRKHSENIGLPVILKSSNGGGGKGIRILEHIKDIETFVNQIKAESSGSIFVMKLAQDSKHLEVQIASDGKTVITLGTRDCSTQRRRQKLIEEAPASFPSQKIIKLMEDSARKIVASVGLKGVCTVEFLLEGNDNLSFMEVNPRLQVEHIVTETIFNINLPSIQVQLAEGKKIKEIFPDYNNLKHKGHAISIRINSEDGYNKFKPLTGKINNISFNSSPNTWAYFSVNNYSEISSSVDNQFGHIVAWGKNREIARKRMILFLENLKINSEMINTANFLKELLKKDIFIKEQHNVRYLDKTIFNKDINEDLLIMSSLIIKTYNQYQNDIELKIDLIKRGHTKINRYISFKYNTEVQIDDLIYNAEIIFYDDNSVIVLHNNNKYKFEYKFYGSIFYLFIKKDYIYSININFIDDYVIKTNISGKSYSFYNPIDLSENRASVSGFVKNILYKKDDYVKKGTPVIIIEIMKMAVEINCEINGRIEYFVDTYETIEKNQLLFKIHNNKSTFNKLKKGYLNNINKYSEIILKPLSVNKKIDNKYYKYTKKLNKREICYKLNTTYIYDLIEKFNYKKKNQLILNENNDFIVTNDFITDSMIVFEIILKNNQKFILIANDITINAGSFSWDDDKIFYEASKYCRLNNLPRIYISCNSGARLEINNLINDKFKIKWKNNNINDGFDFIYLDDNDYMELKNEIESTEKIINNKHYNIITGIKNDGIKNLNGSALIASETSKCFDEIFTLTYVTGRSVGIGAYLTKLGMRTIQKNDSPILLTGNKALNKVLGKDLYLDNLEIGGPDIMSVNSISHKTVNTDEEGIKTIEKWLSFLKVEPYKFSEKKISFNVNKIDCLNEFFDKDSIFELFESWGGSILAGKARLNGFPITYLLCNDEMSITKIPIDPGDLKSEKYDKYNPGSVFNSDASQKVAQIIMESNIEKLPLIFLVNLRGFSGGTKDMLDQILTHGSNIVRNLEKYEHPVYIYLMPNSQLRGGAMVVISKFINKEKIEIYADPSSRANILEPSGLKTIKFKNKDILNKIKNDNQEVNDNNIKKYNEAVLHFCKLHDNINACKDQFDNIIKWSDSRNFFSNKIKNYYEDI